MKEYYIALCKVFVSTNGAVSIVPYLSLFSAEVSTAVIARLRRGSAKLDYCSDIRMA